MLATERESELWDLLMGEDLIPTVSRYAPRRSKYNSQFIKKLLDIRSMMSGDTIFHLGVSYEDVMRNDKNDSNLATKRRHWYEHIIFSYSIRHLGCSWAKDLLLLKSHNRRLCLVGVHRISELRYAIHQVRKWARR